MKALKKITIALGLTALFSLPALANAHPGKHNRGYQPNKVVKIAPKHHRNQYRNQYRHRYYKPRRHYTRYANPWRRYNNNRPIFIFRIN